MNDCIFQKQLQFAYLSIKPQQMGNFSTGQNSAYQIDKIFQELNSPQHSHHHSHSHHSKKHNIMTITQDQICYSGFATPKGNVIWTSVLTVSYSDFRKLIMHDESLTLSQNSSSQNKKIIKALHESKINKKDIADSQTYIRNGSQQVHIYHTHLKKSPQKTFYNTKREMSEADSVIIYGCLVKNLVFKSELRADQKLQWFYSGVNEGLKQSKFVDAIGFTSVESLKEIKIIPDVQWKTFFVGFKVRKLLEINKQENLHNCQSPEKEDVVYILSVGSQSTKDLSIEQIINKVMSIQHQKPIDERQSSQRLSKLTIPAIKIDQTYHYKILEGVQLSNKELNGKNLRLIEQVEVQIIAGNSDNKEPEESLVSQSESTELNRLEIEIGSAFWLIVCREGKLPYLVVKINQI